MTRVQDYIDTTVRLTLGSDVAVRFLVDERWPDDITLVIGESAVKIRFAPATVEALRDKAEVALRDSQTAMAKLRTGTAAPCNAPGLATSPAAETDLVAGGQVA